jgi:hypothetical protein
MAPPWRLDWLRLVFFDCLGWSFMGAFLGLGELRTPSGVVGKLYLLPKWQSRANDAKKHHPGMWPTPLA